METVTIDIFNKGILSFGKDVVIKIINEFYNTYNNLPFISIGSGYGAIELASNINNNINWICVDIDPLTFPIKQYLNKPLTKVDYKTTDELIKYNPSIVNNCIIFLNWCEPNESTYDYEAIIKLKPKAILSIYEVFDNNYGAAGGKKFFEWTLNNEDYFLKEMYYLSPYNDYDDDENVEDIRIGWWEDSNCLYNEDSVHIYIKSKIKHNKSCNIM
jgi:hypothetical protein